MTVQLSTSQVGRHSVSLLDSLLSLLALNVHTYGVKQCLHYSAASLALAICDYPAVCGQLSAPLSWISGITLAHGQGPKFCRISRYVMPLYMD